jgi:hypothetical protein
MVCFLPFALVLSLPILILCMQVLYVTDSDLSTSFFFVIVPYRFIKMNICGYKLDDVNSDDSSPRSIGANGSGKSISVHLDVGADAAEYVDKKSNSESCIDTSSNAEIMSCVQNPLGRVQRKSPMHNSKSSADECDRESEDVDLDDAYGCYEDVIPVAVDSRYVADVVPVPTTSNPLSLATSWKSGWKDASASSTSKHANDAEKLKGFSASGVDSRSVQENPLMKNNNAVQIKGLNDFSNPKPVSFINKRRGALSNRPTDYSSSIDKEYKNGSDIGPKSANRLEINQSGSGSAECAYDDL